MSLESILSFQGKIVRVYVLKRLYGQNTRSEGYVRKIIEHRLVTSLYSIGCDYFSK